MLHQNVQSIGNCINQLECVLNEHNCNVLAVSEHWKSEDQLAAYRIDGFNMVSSFCRESGKHGGVALYVSQNMWSKVRGDINSLSEELVFECAAADIKTGKVKLVIVSLYRAPCSQVQHFLYKLNELLNLLVNNNATFVIAGDFNIDVSKYTKDKLNFISLLDSYNVNITISDFTRITHTSKSCIDNFLTNINVKHTSTVLHTNISDHTTQKLSASYLNNYQPNYKRIRVFSEDNMNFFLNTLSETSWSTILECKDDMDVNQQWDDFISCFLNIFNQSFPIKKIMCGNNPKSRHFRSPEVNTCREKLSTLAVISKYDNSYKVLYDNEKNKLRNLLIKEKKEYCKNEIHNSDNLSKTVWKVAGTLASITKKHTSSNLNVDDDSKLNELNRYFANSGEHAGSDPSTSIAIVNIMENPCTFSFDLATQAEILVIVKCFANKNSFGYDEISTSVVKKCIEHIINPLTVIINNSFKYGIFPESLKMAKVVPIYKKGDANLPESYRPISVLPTFSKIFERLCSNRMVSFFNECNLFSVNQHGFLKGKCVNTAIFEYVNAIYNGLEHGWLCLGISLDFSKAYDCINHEMLLIKLEKYGVRGASLNWLKSYLSNRKQFVNINTNGINKKSDVRTLSRGIPQGSVMGPLLFNIFMIDFCELFNNTPHTHVNYADDNFVLILAKDYSSMQSVVSDLMSRIEQWALSNQQKLNMEKTNFILFRTVRQNIPPTILDDNDFVQLNNSVKFLGLVIDNKLNFDGHVSFLSKKLNGICYCLKILKQYLDMHTLKCIYYGIFVANLKFAILFWGNASDALRVFVIQKHAMRIIFNIPFRESCRGKFRMNRILTCAGIYIYECLIFNFKHKAKFVEYLPNHTYNSRNKLYNYPKHKLSMLEKGPSYASIKLFNRLPKNIRDINNYKVFTREVFNLLIRIEPYTISEFFNYF